MLLYTVYPPFDQEAYCALEPQAASTSGLDGFTSSFWQAKTKLLRIRNAKIFFMVFIGLNRLHKFRFELTGTGYDFVYEYRLGCYRWGIKKLNDGYHLSLLGVFQSITGCLFWPSQVKCPVV